MNERRSKIILKLYSFLLLGYFIFILLHWRWGLRVSLEYRISSLYSKCYYVCWYNDTPLLKFQLFIFFLLISPCCYIYRLFSILLHPPHVPRSSFARMLHDYSQKRTIFIRTISPIFMIFILVSYMVELVPPKNLTIIFMASYFYVWKLPWNMLRSLCGDDVG